MSAAYYGAPQLEQGAPFYARYIRPAYTELFRDLALSDLFSVKKTETLYYHSLFARRQLRFYGPVQVSSFHAPLYIVAYQVGIRTEYIVKLYIVTRLYRKTI